MMFAKIVVLDGYALNPGDLSWDGLRALGETTVYDRTAEADVVSRAVEANIVLTNKTPLRASTLAKLPRLRCVSVLATGYNVVDVEAAKALAVPVCNVPTYGTYSVAQHTFALILELCHRVGLHADDVRAGGWSRKPDWSYSHAPLMELAGKTLGLVGYGRIAQQVAKIGAAMGMTVLAHSPSRVTGGDGVARFVTLETVLAEADFVSLHCPLTPANQGLINDETITRMKRSAYLINTARGALVVEADLAAALNSGRLAGAALDVLSAEPPPAENPLLTAAHCLVTPHNAWATREARTRLMAATVENVRAFLSGTPQNVVNP
jgi:glycerate dehydrogenase